MTHTPIKPSILAMFLAFCPSFLMAQELTRDKPITTHVTLWGEDTLAHASSTWWQISPSLEVTPLTLDALEGSLHLAGVLEDGTPFVVVGDRVAWKAKDAWKTRALPEGLEAETLPWLRVAGTPDTLVLLSTKTVYVWTGEGFEAKALQALPKDPGIRGIPNHVLREGSTLLVGFDRGEWGGGLLRLNLEDGSFEALTQPGEEERGHSLPVQALERAPDGSIYAVLGLAHLGLRNGILLRAKAELRFDVVVFTDAFDAEATQDWSHPATSFHDIAFDTQGRLHLLTGGLGVLRRDAEGWTRLTPSWPEFMYVDTLHVRGDVAVIGAYDAGLLFWDLSNDTWRRPHLEP